MRGILQFSSSSRIMLTFGLGTFFYVILLSINAVAILNEERFLAQSISGLIG
jgi:protein-S-isoprenylcysteine O-methyltransferase Ste14